MSWDMKCWDLFYKLYWSLSHVGLTQDKNGEIGTPGVPTRYIRSKTVDEIFERLSGDEDTLNFFFDILLGIAPDHIIRRLLVAPLSMDDSGPFRSMSFRECADRFNWGHANTTQPDGFIVSEQSLICVEIKLEAPTSHGQVLKYAALCVLEEEVTGRRRNVGLIYVVPPNRMLKTLSQIGGRSGTLGRAYAQTGTLPLRGFASQIYRDRQEHFDSVLDRMTVAIISWQQIYEAIRSELAALSAFEPSQQTLFRLLDGFMQQLSRHRKTGIVT